MSDSCLFLTLVMAVGMGVLIGYTKAACKYSNECVNCIYSSLKEGDRDE